MKILLSIAAVLVLFLGYVSTRNGEFHYEHSGVINAPADKIYPYLSNFKLGSQWNPFARKDPNMKSVFKGEDGKVGSVMEFEGNSEAGAGSLEMLKMVPNELVEIKLLMLKPFKAENLIRYRLAPEGTGTKFTWEMSGNGGFMGKLIGVFINCEKMLEPDFTKGIADLKTTVESQK